MVSIQVRQKYHLSLNEVYVSNESMISYKSNKYSVAKKFIGLKVGLIVMRDELHIYYDKKIICVHNITNHVLNIKKEHELFYIKHPSNQEKNLYDEHIIHEMRHIKYD
jgi:putative transposon-encoded protein